MKKFLPLILLTLICLPVLAAAQPASPTGSSGGLVPCNGPDCTFTDLFELAGRMIRFLLYTVAVPFCALMITYGGIKISMNSVNPGEKDKGKEIVKVAVVGLLLALASYLIVDAVLSTFTNEKLNTIEVSQ